MGRKGKSYRGQSEQKSYKIGCGCFYCTGTDKEDRRLIEEKRLDKETKEIINNVDLYNVSNCDNPHCIDGVVDEIYGEKIYCSNCEDK